MMSISATPAPTVDKGIIQLFVLINVPNDMHKHLIIIKQFE